MRIKLLILTGVVALTLGGAGLTQEGTMPRPTETIQVLDRHIIKRVKVHYLLFLPNEYTPEAGKRWPTILFLHGIGERGTDPQKVKLHGPPKVAEKMSNFPFIVVSPQCPDGEWWSNEVLGALLDEIVERYAVDTNRIYLTGLSMGGYGAWSLALESPGRFAAVAPICGGGNPRFAKAYDERRKADLRSLPFWAFHGDQDAAVTIDESERMVKALREFGCDVKFTVYPGVGHDSWTQTYDNPELYEWFLKQTRKPAS